MGDPGPLASTGTSGTPSLCNQSLCNASMFKAFFNLTHQSEGEKRLKHKNLYES